MLFYLRHHMLLGSRINPWGSGPMYHYGDVIMSMMASQITDISIVYMTVCLGANQRKHQSSASLAFERGIHRWPVNSPHKEPVTRKMFPFDDVIIVPANNGVQFWWLSLFHIDGLVHESRNSRALAIELRLSLTHPPSQVNSLNNGSVADLRSHDKHVVS